MHSQVTPVDADTDAEGGEEERPAVILANCGQLRWNRRQGRAMTRVSWDSQTRESAVHDAPLYEPGVNTVEGQGDQKAHISYLLSTVVPELCKDGAKLDVIAIADSARYVCEVLDENWGELKGRMESLAVIFPFHDRKVYQDEGFKTWLEERARGYIMADSPGGKGVFGPHGGKEAWQWGYGMNVYGLPVEVAEESVFPRHFRGIVDWMGEVAGDKGYVNEMVVAVDVEVETVEEVGEQWGKELVGAEIWETEAGRAQLMGEVAGEGEVEAEKGDVDGVEKRIESVNVRDVEAQPDKAELEKDTVQPQKENTKWATVQSKNEATAQETLQKSHADSHSLATTAPQTSPPSPPPPPPALPRSHQSAWSVCRATWRQTRASRR